MCSHHEQPSHVTCTPTVAQPTNTPFKQQTNQERTNLPYNLPWTKKNHIEARSTRTSLETFTSWERNSTWETPRRNGLPGEYFPDSCLQSLLEINQSSFYSRAFTTQSNENLHAFYFQSAVCYIKSVIILSWTIVQISGNLRNYVCMVFFFLVVLVIITGWICVILRKEELPA